MDQPALGGRMTADTMTSAALWLAQESTGDAPLMTKLISYAELFVTIMLTVASFGLWWVTVQVHRDEVTQMADHLADANDNMTDVALAEIDAHHRNMNRIRLLRQNRRNNIRTTRRVVHKTTLRSKP